MSPFVDRARRLEPWLSWAVVTAVGLVLLWPVPAGHMPLSADHTVHLTRTWMWAQELAAGHLRGWSPIWFFGTPVGELYPVLGDLWIIVLRVSSLGALGWDRAYALGFTLVFLTQGWALLRAGRAMGLGPLPGLVAALAVLLDAGAYREGGWDYTVTYGVWPQALSTALCWLGLGELARACSDDHPIRRRRWVGTAALALGGSLLAHPVALVTLALATPLAVLGLAGPHREALRRSTGTTAVVLLGALGVAAWWLLPMLEHRAWMASYGWLWIPLVRMLEGALQGQWFQHGSTVVGFTIGLGILASAVIGPRPTRFLAATALVSWCMAGSDVVWQLRLDRWSEGFTHLQYQRFIESAKPGLFLCAGAAVGLMVAGGERLRSRSAVGAGLVWALAASVSAWMIVDTGKVARARNVGTIQFERLPGHPEIDGAHQDLVAWLAERWDERQEFFRATVREHRNLHWFVDASVGSGIPIYKQGFTPGDNFVHKPETGTAALLDRLRVRYEVRRGRRARGPGHVLDLGALQVFERPGWDHPVAWAEGPGQVEVLQADLERNRVRVRVEPPQPGERTRVVFGIAGFPRWTLTDDAGASVPWIEVPVVGDGPSATPSDRRSGMLRGGKAHGDDGTEPTLVAADLPAGEYTLTYRHWRASDVAALLVSLLSVMACVALAWPGRRLPWLDRALERGRTRLAALGHPAAVSLAALAVIGHYAVRQHHGRESERSRAVGQLDTRVHERVHVEAGYLKTEMLIRPAVLVDRRRREPAVVVFADVAFDDALEGWIALNDDETKVAARGRHRVRIEARADDESWIELLDLRVRHRPGMHPLDLDTTALAGRRGDLRVVVESEGDRPPRLGFDLQLSEGG